MLIAHLSDLHLTEGPRLDDETAVLNRIVDGGVEEDVCAWLLTGDLYGHTVPHRSTPRERLALFGAVRRMAEHAPVVVVRGNHDHLEDFEGLAAIGGLHPVHVCTTPRVLLLQTHAGLLDVYAMPYPEKGWLLAGLGALSVEQAAHEVEARLSALLRAWGGQIRMRSHVPAIFAAHVMIRGATTGAGVVLSGNEIELTTGDLAELSGVTYGALGHMHARQNVIGPHWYVGSPWHTAHSSTPQPERVWHLVEASADHEATVTPVSTGARPWVAVEARWTGHRWQVESNHPIGEDLEGAEVRLRMRIAQTDLDTAPRGELLATVEAQRPHRVVVEVVPEPVHRVRAPEVRKAATLEDKIRGYWRSLGEAPPDDEQVLALAALDLLTQGPEAIERAIV